MQTFDVWHVSPLQVPAQQGNSCKSGRQLRPKTVFMQNLCFLSVLGPFCPILRSISTDFSVNLPRFVPKGPETAYSDNNWISWIPSPAMKLLRPLWQRICFIICSRPSARQTIKLNNPALAFERLDRNLCKPSSAYALHQALMTKFRPRPPPPKLTALVSCAFPKEERILQDPGVFLAFSLCCPWKTDTYGGENKFKKTQ